MAEYTENEAAEHTEKAPWETLSLRARPRPVTRLNRRVIGVLLALGIGVLAFALSSVVNRPKPAPSASVALTPGPTTPPEGLAKLPKTYGEIVQPARAAEAPPAPPPPESRPAMPVAVPVTPPPQAAVPAPRPVQHPVPRQEPKRWLFAALQGNVGAPPFPAPKPDVKKAEDTGKAQGLIPAATWALPRDPRQVLYRSQVIPGMLLHDVNSDIPGPVRIMVTQAVVDRFGQDHVLIPQYSYLLGTQDGHPTYGQSRLAVTIDQIELPDGAVVGLQKAKMGDRSGAQGVAGKVNNHWGTVGIAAVLSAVLSVGTRAPFGNVTGFQQTLPQEFGQDVGQSINRTGQQIVNRALIIPPTITLKAGTPVTIQLGEAVSFQQPPTSVSK